MWLWGGMLYIWMISLIFYRYTFFKFSPGDLQPPYWINMGAMAISTLAGARLIAFSGHAMAEDLERSRSAGFDAHLRKPASVENLLKVVAG